MKAAAGIAAAVIYALAAIPYLTEMFRGRTVPNRASWWIWGVNGVLLAGTHFAAGGRHSIWLPLLYATDPFLIAILAIKYGQGGWSRLDRLCIAGAAVSMGIWFVFRDPLPAAISSIAVDTFAMAPTAEKLWRFPGSESRGAWGMAFLANAINLIAVDRWTPGIGAYPVYLVLLTGFGFLLTLRTQSPVQQDLRPTRFSPTSTHASYQPLLVALRPSSMDGLGVFAVRPLEKGQVLFSADVYDDTSRRMAWSEFETLDEVTRLAIWGFACGDPDGCWAPTDVNLVALPWFMNHSCDPNVGFGENDDFVLLRVVSPNEELRWDYATDETNVNFQMECKCDAPVCRGRITGADWLDPGYVERSSKYFSSRLRGQLEPKRM